MTETNYILNYFSLQWCDNRTAHCCICTYLHICLWLVFHQGLRRSQHSLPSSFTADAFKSICLLKPRLYTAWLHLHRSYQLLTLISLKGPLMSCKPQSAVYPLMNSVGGRNPSRTFRGMFLTDK